MKKLDSRTTGLPFHFQPAGNTTFWRRTLPFVITLFYPWLFTYQKAVLSFAS